MQEYSIFSSRSTRVFIFFSFFTHSHTNFMDSINKNFFRSTKMIMNNYFLWINFITRISTRYFQINYSVAAFKPHSCFAYNVSIIAYTVFHRNRVEFLYKSTLKIAIIIIISILLVERTNDKTLKQFYILKENHRLKDY